MLVLVYYPHCACILFSPPVPKGTGGYCWYCRVAGAAEYVIYTTFINCLYYPKNESNFELRKDVQSILYFDLPSLTSS